MFSRVELGPADFYDAIWSAMKIDSIMPCDTPDANISHKLTLDTHYSDPYCFSISAAFFFTFFSTFFWLSTPTMVVIRSIKI